MNYIGEQQVQQQQHSGLNIIYCLLLLLPSFTSVLLNLVMLLLALLQLLRQLLLLP